MGQPGNRKALGQVRALEFAPLLFRCEVRVAVGVSPAFLSLFFLLLLGFFGLGATSGSAKGLVLLALCSDISTLGRLERTI